MDNVCFKDVYPATTKQVGIKGDEVDLVAEDLAEVVRVTMHLPFWLEIKFTSQWVQEQCM